MRGLLMMFRMAMMAAIAMTLAPAMAQTKFPSKPVRVVAGAFGSPSDILARTLS
jgi:tripartite-type tricarboxylate transporter receptor subunit TctC